MPTEAAAGIAVGAVVVGVLVVIAIMTVVITAVVKGQCREKSRSLSPQLELMVNQAYGVKATDPRLERNPAYRVLGKSTFRFWTFR